jgi:hypothetical protein
MYGIFTYIWLIFGIHVGKYSSTMEHMGCSLGYWSSTEKDMVGSSFKNVFGAAFWLLRKKTWGFNVNL